MQALPILAATHLETFVKAMPHLLGMLMVMITLAILWGVCSLTAYLIHHFMPAVAQANAPRAATSGIPPETVAVIAAAVNVVTDEGYKVISIRSQDSNWEKAGRQSVLSSHKIR